MQHRLSCINYYMCMHTATKMTIKTNTRLPPNAIKGAPESLAHRRGAHLIIKYLILITKCWLPNPHHHPKLLRQVLATSHLTPA